MTRDDIIRFARRDWAAVARAKERHWLRRKEQTSYADLLRFSHDLYCHARVMAPDGPSPEVRTADARVHQRVGESLRAVTCAAR